MTGGGVVVLSGAGSGAGVSVGAGVGAGVSVGAGAGVMGLVFLLFGLDLVLLFVFGLLGTMTTCPVTKLVRITELITHTAIITVAFDLRLSIPNLSIDLMAPA